MSARPEGVRGNSKSYSRRKCVFEPEIACGHIMRKEMATLSGFNHHTLLPLTVRYPLYGCLYPLVLGMENEERIYHTLYLQSMKREGLL